MTDTLLTPAGRAPVAAHPDDIEHLLAARPDLTPVECAFIHQAARASTAAHAHQRRASGEPYISHPFAVAAICAELGLDADAIAASLLHDVVEDTALTQEELRRQFGDAVADLVGGVTKIGRVHIPSDRERAVANYRRLLVAMAHDVRVLVIKLADRLHNLRTIDALGRDRQMRIARESLDLYAPLAHRLGIQSLRWEIEDRAFAVLFPQRYGDLTMMVGAGRERRMEYVEGAREDLQRALQIAGIDATVSGRAKHLYSIFQTMQERGKEFNELHDLHALRVIVATPEECYAVVGVLHSMWRPVPGRFKDYIATPKQNGYQSLHTAVIGPDGHTMEIQVRTQQMHDVAELGIAAHWAYKERAEDDQGWRSTVADLATQESSPDALLAHLRAELGDDEEVLVFTPRGDLKALPCGATPVDFAYAVHTDIGHRCVGAKVNGGLVPLSHALSSGDFVEVMTARSSAAPQESWLEFVVTSRARAAILQHHRRERREDIIVRGRQAVDDAIAGQALTAARADALRADLIHAAGVERADAFYLSVGEGHTSAAQLERMIRRRLRREAPRPGQRSARDLGIEVAGRRDEDIRLALCCSPLPGDPLLGCQLHGGGISIHHAECPNARRRRTVAPERIVPATWCTTTTTAIRTEIHILAGDRTRLLEEMAATIAEHGANIVTALCHGDGSLVRARFIIELAVSDELAPLMSDLRRIESIVDVRRVSPRGLSKAPV